MMKAKSDQASANFQVSITARPLFIKTQARPVAAEATAGPMALSLSLRAQIGHQSVARSSSISPIDGGILA
jgi:hypothetical protein